jgi:hypothetical protein
VLLFSVFPIFFCEIPGFVSIFSVFPVFPRILHYGRRCGGANSIEFFEKTGKTENIDTKPGFSQKKTGKTENSSTLGAHLGDFQGKTENSNALEGNRCFPLLFSVFPFSSNSPMSQTPGIHSAKFLEKTGKTENIATKTGFSQKKTGKTENSSTLGTQKKKTGKAENSSTLGAGI